jgi:hypothetical protein
LRESRHEELRQLRATAREYLEAPLSIPSAADLQPCSTLLRLWVYPSFGDEVAWHVIKRGRVKPHLSVRRVCWRQQADAERLLDPLRGLREGFHVAPTVEVRDRFLDVRAFKRCADRLKEINIPLAVAREGISLDGTTFGVELPEARALFEWRDVYAREWEPLVEWAAEVRDWLEEVCGCAPGG